ncbi:serine/threonine-protein kinase [Streptomyces sp. NPDC090127]|uniref:serine/threonine-protein kinase n=1 Tax=Streptomyces sp. NPDC090127 TaxID=3365953 RepID=UPI00382B8F70
MQPLDAGEPRTIGAYRILGRLGAGGMGRVYLARTEGGRTVAVKIVHPHFALDEQFRERFRREVAAARRVGGRWTAPVLDADPDALVPWVATGYVAGPNLTHAVEAAGPLPAHTVRALGAGLAEALAGVHGLGLVHRDVKPSNVLATLEGPRLIDFGIARATDGTASLTASGVSIGSPGYMAPEQILGHGASGASDVFSLGAVLAYAANGAPPFPGDTSAALLYKVVHEEPELGGLSGELLDLVTACLAKSPSARPTPTAVATALAPAGAATLVAAGWLPPRLLEEISRTAVGLLDFDADLDADADTERGADGNAGEGSRGDGPHPLYPHPYASGPVPFTAPSVEVGMTGPPSGVFGPPAFVASELLPDPGVFGPPPGPLGQPVPGGPTPTAPTERRATLSLAGRRVSCTLALALAGALAAVTLGAGFLYDLLPGGDRGADAGKTPGSTSSASPPDASEPTTGTPSREPTPTEPTPAPSTPPTNTAPFAAVPAAFVGTWTGPTTEANGSPHGDFTVVVAKGRTGEDVVRTTHTISVLGTTVSCHGIGRLTAATSTELRIADRTDPDRPGTVGLCTTGASSFTLTLDADGTLAYRSAEEAAGRPTGTLRKS